MDANLPKNPRRNLIVLAVLIVTAICSIPIFISSASLKTIFAILACTAAVVLPIRQKRFSLASIVLVACGFLFLLSGAVDNAYNKIVSPLPVLEQIEFSRFMRPMQVSRGLWNLGFGTLYFLISFVWLQAKEAPENPRSRMWKLGYLFMAVIGVIFALLGITSIVEGLSKL